MQVYEGRDDNRVVLDIVADVFRQLEASSGRSLSNSRFVAGVDRLQKQTDLSDDEIRKFLPDVRTVFSAAVGHAKSLFVFLDDFHVIEASNQPKLLSFLYSVCRGNNVFLKLSAIETLTRSWDSKTHTGLQVPHDAQTINLDYNLTMPDKAATHIEGIPRRSREILRPTIRSISLHKRGRSFAPRLDFCRCSSRRAEHVCSGYDKKALHREGVWSRFLKCQRCRIRNGPARNSEGFGRRCPGKNNRR